MNYLTLFVMFVILYVKYRGGIKCLPDHLRWKVHNDYTFPLNMIPRFLTSYKLCPPVLWAGYNVNNWTKVNGVLHPDPIQRHLNGKSVSWQLVYPLYFQILFKNGYYFMCGARWDSVDFYTTFPALDISPASGFDPNGQGTIR